MAVKVGGKKGKKEVTGHPKVQITLKLIANPLSIDRLLETDKDTPVDLPLEEFVKRFQAQAMEFEHSDDVYGYLWECNLFDDACGSFEWEVEYEYV